VAAEHLKSGERLQSTLVGIGDGVGIIAPGRRQGRVSAKVVPG
jgi:hypothetical protein